jgi:membrane protease YdiL (CAAX protease family)
MTPAALQNKTATMPRKLSALLEVIGVFIGGNFAASGLENLLGLKPMGLLILSAFNSTNPDFIALSGATLQSICLRYACLLLPAFAIGWWRRRLTPKNYGITRARQPVWSLIALGGLCFALVALPIQLLSVVRPLHQLLADKSWTFPFWLFFAVASFAILPVFEELFFRGYCQTRLEEAFGGSGAIMIAALFMTLAHDQYHHLNAVSVGTILALIPIMLGAGYLYWCSRSLIPAIILHMAVNVPTKGIYDFLLPVVMFMAVILFRRRLTNMVRDFYLTMADRGWKGAAFLSTALAVCLVIGFERSPETFAPLALFGLGGAMAFELLQRRRTH